MMKQKLFWILFFFLFGISALIYTGSSVKGIYHYLKLSSLIPLHTIQWSVQEFSAEEYAPKAQYNFYVGEQLYYGKWIWSEHERNPLVVQDIIKKKFNHMKFKVWYNSSNPDESSLERTFPLKQTIYALILWGLLFYFYRLSVFVNKRGW